LTACAIDAARRHGLLDRIDTRRVREATDPVVAEVLAG
jgi:hypothetical protein